MSGSHFKPYIMSNPIIDNTRQAIRHWYLSLILGILFIIVGIWIWRTPVESYMTLALLFSITFFVNGIFEIIYYAANRGSVRNWGWGLFAGIVDLVFGIWLLSDPSLSMEVLPLFVGFILLFRSITAITVSFHLSARGAPGWGFLLVLGILGLLFSIVLLLNPVIAGVTLVIWTGMAFIAIGIFRVLLAFRLRSLNQRLKKSGHL